MGLLTYATVVMKVVHIAALCLWLAGLIILPLLFRAYRPGLGHENFRRFRKLTHYGYIRFLTPAAVVAVAAGIALILLRGIFEPWLIIKLFLVSGLAMAHAYIGHMIVLTAETAGAVRLPSPVWPLAAVLALSFAILFVVLAKPDIAAAFPHWMMQPQSLDLPDFAGVSSFESPFGRKVPI